MWIVENHINAINVCMWVNIVQHMTDFLLHHECWPQYSTSCAEPTWIVENHVNGVNVRMWVNNVQHHTLMYITKVLTAMFHIAHGPLWIVDNHVNALNIHIWVNSVQHHTLMGLSMHVRVRYDTILHLWNHACVGYYYWSKLKITTSKRATTTNK